MDEQPPEVTNEVKQESRRDFLKRFIGDKRGELLKDSSKEADKLIRSLSQANVSRRRIMTATAGVGTALILEHTLNGLPSSLMKQFLRDPDGFLGKLGSSIQEGELLEDIQQSVESRMGNHGDIELGEQIDMSESWLDSSFSSYEVRRITRDGQDTENLMIIAEVSRVSPVAVHYDPFVEGGRLALANFTKTAEDNGPFATLPSNQVRLDSSNRTMKPYVYSAYQLEDESIVEYFEDDGARRNRGGALILTGNSLEVTSGEQAGRYKVGENNIRAIETVAFTVSSETKAADLLEINNTDVYGGAKLADSPRFDSFIVSFKDQTGQIETVVFSTYQHLDATSLEITGELWDSNKRMTVIQAANICDQLKEERGYESYIIAVPDPEEQSRIVSSDTYTQDQVRVLRQSGVNLRVPTQITGEQFGQKAHRTIGMEFPVDTIYPRPHFLITKNT